jgi:BirA family biotin operon repressor/biotin-[acetyl-CoA-carboxylase] ligase
LSAENKGKKCVGLFGSAIYRFEEVNSTNDIAKDFAIKGEKEGVVVVSEKQRNGRGRIGRSWFSPRGGLWFSIIMRPKIRAYEMYKLTFIVAVSVVNVLNQFGISSAIKWPNDVLVKGKKICGILTEINSKNDQVEFAIIGVGINVNIEIRIFAESHGFSATSIRECLGKDIDSCSFFSLLLSEIEQNYEKFVRTGFEPILKEWKKNNCVLNSNVEVYESGERFSGLALDIDDNGGLLIRLDNGTVKSIVSGDLNLLND